MVETAEGRMGGHTSMKENGCEANEAAWLTVSVAIPLLGDTYDFQHSKK